MTEQMDRRGFVKKSVAASTGAALSFCFEDRILQAHAAEGPSEKPETKVAGSIPMGKMGDLSISRLIIGGNLISGHAHSRDLIYVSKLLKQYFTDDKVMETLHRAEECGVNTAIIRLDQDTLRILDRYWNKEGGKIQWIVQVKPTEKDLTTAIDVSIDKGACGIYIQGETADRMWRQKRVDLIGKATEHIKKQGVIAGIGAHMLNVIVACEEAGFNPDFYMKTFNSKSYWSAGPAERHDSVWEETPEETEEFMAKVNKPWIAFKVLGAGAIHPREGFKYAFEKGADFLCVGMFDFQVAEDAEIARETLAGEIQRNRPWCA